MQRSLVPSDGQSPLLTAGGILEAIMRQGRTRMEFFTAEHVRGMRSLMRRVLDLTPERENQLPQGLSISPIDPSCVVECLSCLRLKQGLRLRGYQFCEGSNGNGFVYAVPEDADFPAPAGLAQGRAEVVPGVFLPQPQPPGALEHYMDAFEGDGSPLSFLEASIVFRELQEFGAIWHGCDWSTHTVLDSNPLRSGRGIPDDPCWTDVGTPEDWRWNTEEPSDWRPCVTLKPKGGAIVEFITFSALGSARFVRSVDVYPDSSMRAQSKAKTLAQVRDAYRKDKRSGGRPASLGARAVSTHSVHGRSGRSDQ